MFKRYASMLCVLISVGVVADNPDGSLPGDACNCHSRVKLGYQNDTFPFTNKTITLHRNGAHEYLEVVMTLKTNQSGVCSPYSCNTQEDCLLEYEVRWRARNYTGHAWILDIGGPPGGANVTETIPDETFESGKLAGNIKVDKCGGVDFITFNLTIDGITAHFPITIWCNPCKDSPPDY